MKRMLKRVEALQSVVRTDAVVAALDAFQKTGVFPPGPAGARASEIWEESAGVGVEGDDWRHLWCTVKATGKSIAQMVQEELSAEG